MSGKNAAVLEPAAAGTGPAPEVTRRHGPDWMLVAPPAVTLVMMLWGIAGPSYTFDESDTLSATSRTIPQLFKMLGHVDAVHGLYYLALWPVVHLIGSTESETRLPSAIAMAAAALGIAAIGRRVRSRRAGLYAGLLFAVLPAAALTGHNARPYPLEVAVAVLTSYLLLRVADAPQPRWLAAYGGSLVLLGYMHMFGLLIIPAHAVTLIPAARAARARPAAVGAGSRLGDRALAVRWLVTVASSGVLTIPVIWFGWLQRGQVAWIPKPTWHDIPAFGIALTSNPAVEAVIGALIVLGAVRADWPAGLRLPLTRRTGKPDDHVLLWLAVSWLVLPPILLLLASLYAPVYQAGYLIYCLPAATLLAGAGLAVIGGPLPYAALAVIAALLWPTQLAIRSQYWGADRLQQASQVLARHERPGDAVYYPGTVPPWYLCYPGGFGQLRDISFGQTAGQTGRLSGPEPPPRIIDQRLRSVQRLWIIEQAKPSQPWKPVLPDLSPGFRLQRQWLVGFLKLRLYIRIRAS